MTSFAFTFDDTVIDWLKRFVSRDIDLLSLSVRQYFGLCKIIKLCVLNYVSNNTIYYFRQPKMLFSARYYDQDHLVKIYIDQEYSSFIEVHGKVKEITHKSLPEASMEQWLMVHLDLGYLPSICLCCCDHIFSVMIAQSEAQKPLYEYAGVFGIVHQDVIYAIDRKLITYMKKITLDNRENDEDRLIRFIETIR